MFVFAAAKYGTSSKPPIDHICGKFSSLKIHFYNSFCQIITIINVYKYLRFTEFI